MGRAPSLRAVLTHLAGRLLALDPEAGLEFAERIDKAPHRSARAAAQNHIVACHRTQTSVPANRNPFGRRTAWLRPCKTSLARGWADSITTISLVSSQ